MDTKDLIRIGLIMLTGLILLYLFNNTYASRDNNITSEESYEPLNENFYGSGEYDNEKELINEGMIDDQYGEHENMEGFFDNEHSLKSQEMEHFTDSKKEYNVQPNSTNGFNFENLGNTDENGNEKPGDCFPKDQLTPDELLPGDVNSKWAQVNPAGQGELGDQNFLNAGFHVGVNTVGQTLRNANLQLRSEPPNPQVKVSPWLQSTIEPDSNRKPMEIGGCE